MTSIADKKVLITGANRGIGQALMQEALARGASQVYAGTRAPIENSDSAAKALEVQYAALPVDILAAS